jgi:redox-sensing transcriptional repressor
MVENNDKNIPTLGAIRRLGKYLQILLSLRNEESEFVSASRLSRELGIHETQIRRDLALTGCEGRPKVGHNRDELIWAIQNYLNLNNTNDAFLVGAGHLGNALLAYNAHGRFSSTGIKIIAAFDINPAVVGQKIHGIEVFHLSKMRNLAKRMGVHVGIITTSPESAQEVADLMVEAGIIGIWNFALSNLNLPSHIILENAEMESGLAIISRRLKEQLRNNSQRR